MGPTTDTRTFVFSNGSLGQRFESSDIVVRFYRALEGFNGTNGDEVKPVRLLVSLETDHAIVEYVLERSGNFYLDVQIKGSQVLGYPKEVNDTVVVETSTHVLGSPYSIIIYPAKADPSMTTCRGVGLRTASHSAHAIFEMTLRDTFGNQLVVGGNQFYMRLLGDAESHLVRPSMVTKRNNDLQNPSVLSDPAIPICQDLLNGKYLCSYMPMYSGPHELHIMLLNYSTSQPGGLGLSGLHYSGLSLGASIEEDPEVVKKIHSGPLSFTWINGYALPVSSMASAGRRRAGQFIRWDGFLISPRTDLFSFSIQGEKMSTALYLDKYLVWDSDSGYETEMNMILGVSYEFVLEVKIEARYAEAGELSMKVLWKTSSYQQAVIPGFFLYDSAQHVSYSPFYVNVSVT